MSKTMCVGQFCNIESYAEKCADYEQEKISFAKVVLVYYLMFFAKANR